MVPASAELREFAEVPERFVEIPVGISVERSDDERRCILRGRSWASVAGIDVDLHDLDDLVAEVRDLVPTECDTLWHLGPSSRPKELLEELTLRGFAPPARRPSEVRVLALSTEPDALSDVDVRPLETFEEFVAARHVAWEAFDVPEERRAVERKELQPTFDEMQQTGLPVWFIVCVEGRVAGSAVAVPSTRGVVLGGGSVALWARGRGLYRAMVRARWEYAISLKAPALVTHANPTTSYPILLGLGFEEIGTVRRLQEGLSQ